MSAGYMHLYQCDMTWYVCICVVDVFYAFLIHLPRFVLGDRVPAALRRPREKHDPDVFIKFVCFATCLRRFGDLKKRHSWIFRRVSVIQTPNLSGWDCPPQSLIPEQCMHLSSTMHAPTESLFPHRVRGIISATYIIYYIRGPWDTFIQVDMISNYMFRLWLRGMYL